MQIFHPGCSEHQTYFSLEGMRMYFKINNTKTFILDKSHRNLLGLLKYLLKKWIVKKLKHCITEIQNEKESFYLTSSLNDIGAVRTVKMGRS